MTKMKAALLLAPALSLIVGAQEFEPEIYVETFAGSHFRGYVEGVGELTQFSHPDDITVDAQTNVFVLDVGNKVIRKITPERVVSTVATNSSFLSGSVFAGESGVLVGGGGILSAILRVRGASFDVVFGHASFFGYVDSSSKDKVRLGGVRGITEHAGHVYFTDQNRVRVGIVETGGVATLAGSGNSESVDGFGVFSSFKSPRDTAIFGKSLYVSEENTIRRIELESTNVSTVATGGYFWSLTIDSGGTIYAIDQSNQRIVVLRQDGRKTIIGGGTGYADGAASAARFYDPRGIAIGPDDYVYVADTFNNRVRRFKAPPRGAASEPMVAAGMYPGISIIGELGRKYRIESSDSPDSTEWRSVGEITLSKSPQLWIDQLNAGAGKRFYRAAIVE